MPRPVPDLAKKSEAAPHAELHQGWTEKHTEAALSTLLFRPGQPQNAVWKQLGI